MFSTWKEALGGRIEYIVTAAAAMNPVLPRLFTAAGIPILEGYGLTGTSPVLTVNRMDETSGGKYVAPQQVEMAMMTSRFIEQIMVHGENHFFTHRSPV